jgi:hypothetical protein
VCFVALKRLQPDQKVPRAEACGGGWELYVGALAQPDHQGVEALRRDWATSLRTKYVGVGRLLPLQTTERPQLVALDRVNARRSSFAAPNVQAPGIQLDLMPLQVADLGSS